MKERRKCERRESPEKEERERERERENILIENVLNNYYFYKI